MEKLDILISNAAILGTLGPIHQSTYEFIEVLNVNLVVTIDLFVQ